jgi:hypothetical protein
MRPLGLGCLAETLARGGGPTQRGIGQDSNPRVHHATGSKPENVATGLLIRGHRQHPATTCNLSRVGPYAHDRLVLRLQALLYTLLRVRHDQICGVVMVTRQTQELLERTCPIGRPGQ